MLGPREFAVTGDAGDIYGVNIPGGVILVVIHEPALLDQVRSSAAKAVEATADLLAGLPPPPPPPAWPPVPHDAHGHAIERPQRPARPIARKTAAKKAPPQRKPAAKKKVGPKKKGPVRRARTSKRSR